MQRQALKNELSEGSQTSTVLPGVGAKEGYGHSHPQR